MFKSQKNVFWQALVVTVLIFGIGIFFGILIENFRTGKIISLHQNSEVDLLDINLQNALISSEEFNCDTSQQYIIDFANRIYEEARLLEKYDEASRLTEDIKLQHKKYDVLRASLFLNALQIKQKCFLSYHVIVYFYDYNDPSLEKKARQGALSKLLLEIKEERGEEIILIPIAADNNLVSVDMILEKFGVKKENLPAVLIDGKQLVTNIYKKDDLEQYLN